MPLDYVKKETKTYLIEYSYMTERRYIKINEATSLKECLMKFITENIGDSTTELFSKALVGCDDNKSIIDMFNAFFVNKRTIHSLHVINETLYIKD